MNLSPIYVTVYLTRPVQSIRLNDKAMTRNVACKTRSAVLRRANNKST